MKLNKYQCVVKRAYSLLLLTIICISKYSIMSVLGPVFYYTIFS